MAIPLAPIQNNELTGSAIRQKQQSGTASQARWLLRAKAIPAIGRNHNRAIGRYKFCSEVDALTVQGGTVSAKGKVCRRKAR